MFTLLIERDLAKMTEIENLPGVTFRSDAKGHQITVVVKKDREPYPLTGDIVGYFIRGDNTTVSANGTKVENQATVVFPADAFAAEGPLTIIVKNVDGNRRTTLAACRCRVLKSRTT